MDIATIKDAYDTLSSPSLRAQYDAAIQGKKASVPGPRPAQMVSLEDFEEDLSHEGTWRYRCRCGGAYRITELDMEKDIHLTGCDSCSEAIWVGFELAEE
ncbi:Diphthamide biosynthesis protein 4 [Paramarasmius palmivorus]|uniref:Diphthamide biosynthesis protein 3 n=1 Tax=Paramarasmius palmivorus TaxID=297713 RepID=A0AAW0DIM6_9AGAR